MNSASKGKTEWHRILYVQFSDGMVKGRAYMFWLQTISKEPVISQMLSLLMGFDEVLVFLTKDFYLLFLSYILYDLGCI